MHRRPVHRLTTAFFVVVSLLFSQAALANYVCPGQLDRTAMAAMMASGQPCSGMDTAQPTLCHQGAAGAAQSFEAVKLSVLWPPALLQALVVPPVLEAQALIAVPLSATPQARPPPDPLFLSTLRLRV